MTQKQIAFTVLRENANEWVSGNALVEAGVGWRYAARIAELREAGWQIESRPDPTGASRVYQYRLVLLDVAPGQTTWIAA